MTHPADSTLAATLRQARARSWGAASPLRTHYPGPNALRQASAGGLVVESARAENTELPEEMAQSRRRMVADELARRGMDESASAARWAWEQGDDNQARQEREEAQRHSRSPATEEPISRAAAAGILAAAALAGIGGVLLAESVDNTVHTVAGVDGSDPVLDGDRSIGLSPAELAADLGSVDLGALPVLDTAPGVSVGDELAAAASVAGASIDSPAPDTAPSVEIGGGPDFG